MVKVADRIRTAAVPPASYDCRCQELGAINLAQGLCQVPPPAALLAEGRATSESRPFLQPAEGLPGFREAVADKLKRYSGLSVDPATQVVATVGATGALMATLTALLDEATAYCCSNPSTATPGRAAVLDLRPEPVRLIGPDFEITEAHCGRPITEPDAGDDPLHAEQPDRAPVTAAELAAVRPSRKNTTCSSSPTRCTRTSTSAPPRTSPRRP